MKIQLYIILMSTVVVNVLQAQTPEDALKYNYTQQGGTARNMATGGAMASLGGEFTTLFVNPAGLSMYRTNEFVATAQYNFTNYNNSFRGTNSSSDNNRFKFANLGFIMGSGDVTNGKDDKKKNFAFGIGFNKTADFNSDVSYQGLNNVTSYSEKFLEELRYSNADPNAGARNFPFGSSLAINTYLVDPIYNGSRFTGNYKSYALNALSAGLLQKQRISTRGGAYDIALGGAINHEDKFHFGGSVSFLYTTFKRNNSFEESEQNPIVNNSFNSFKISDETKVSGGGFNIKIGGIYRPTERVRLGLAIHSPNIYSLTETQNVTMETDTENYVGYQKQTSSDVLNVTPNTLNESKYNFTTPWRFMLSGSYVFREVESTKRQRAFITADIEYLNYRNVSYRASDEQDINYNDYLKSLKSVTKSLYRGAFNARLGAELKLHTIMFRAGAAYYGNPLKDKEILKTDNFNLSAGIGYRNKGYFIDAAYVHTIGRGVDIPYRLVDKANTFATVKSNTGQIALTFGKKF
jgi:hypothetical protein